MRLVLIMGVLGKLIGAPFGICLHLMRRPTKVLAYWWHLYGVKQKWNSLPQRNNWIITVWLRLFLHSPRSFQLGPIHNELWKEVTDMECFADFVVKDWLQGSEVRLGPETVYCKACWIWSNRKLGTTFLAIHNSLSNRIFFNPLGILC